MGKRKTWLLAALIAVMLIAAGCQAVGGIDLNKVLLDNAKTKSMTGSSSIALELMLNEEALNKLEPEEKNIVQLFSKTKLEFSDVKQQDANHISVKGSFTYGKGSIPFAMSASGDRIVLQLEGAKRPIVVQTAGLYGADRGFMELAQQMQGQLTESGQKMFDAAGGYLIKNLPNPKTIQVDKVEETIHGEKLSLHKVHTEFYGNEIIDLLKSLITNLLNDEKGLKEAVAQITDITLTMMQQIGAAGEDADLPQPTEEEKAKAVEELYSMIHDGLKETVAQFDELEKEATASLSTVLNDKTYLKADLYVDGDLKVRKSNFELAIVPSFNDAAKEQLSELGEQEGIAGIEQGLDGLKGIKLTVASETWSANEEVAIDTIDTKTVYPLFLNEYTKLSPNGFLNMLDSKSTLYDLLKNDLHITRTDVNLYDDGYSLFPPIVEGDVTYGPIRYVAESLYANVVWNEEMQQITVYDEQSGKTIVMTMGSSKAEVNGREIDLGDAVGTYENSVYVPIIPIVEELGGSAEWSEDGTVLSIHRE